MGLWAGVVSSGKKKQNWGWGAAGERLICGDKGGSPLWMVERTDRITLKRG